MTGIEYLAKIKPAWQALVPDTDLDGLIERNHDEIVMLLETYLERKRKRRAAREAASRPPVDDSRVREAEARAREAEAEARAVAADAEMRARETEVQAASREAEAAAQAREAEERAREAEERAREAEARAIEAEIQAEDAEARAEAAEVVGESDIALVSSEPASLSQDDVVFLLGMFKDMIARMDAALDEDPSLSIDQLVDIAIPPESAEGLGRLKSGAIGYRYRRLALEHLRERGEGMSSVRAVPFGVAALDPRREPLLTKKEIEALFQQAYADERKKLGQPPPTFSLWFPLRDGQITQEHLLAEDIGRASSWLVVTNQRSGKVEFIDPVTRERGVLARPTRPTSESMSRLPRPPSMRSPGYRH